MRADPATRQRQPHRAGLPGPVKPARNSTREARGRGGGTSARVRPGMGCWRHFTTIDAARAWAEASCWEHTAPS